MAATKSCTSKLITATRAMKAGSPGRGRLGLTTFRRANSRIDRHQAGSEQGLAWLLYAAEAAFIVGSAFEREEQHCQPGPVDCSVLLLAAYREASDSDACFLYYGDASSAQRLFDRRQIGHQQFSLPIGPAVPHLPDQDQ
jgi:hypothetical protein